jgi:hypothetical protein
MPLIGGPCRRCMLWVRSLHHHTVRQITIDTARPFPENHGRGNRYLLIVMDYFTKGLEVYVISNQGHQRWLTFWWRFASGSRGNCRTTKAGISINGSYKRCSGASESARRAPHFFNCIQKAWWNAA